MVRGDNERCSWKVFSIKIETEFMVDFLNHLVRVVHSLVEKTVFRAYTVSYIVYRAKVKKNKLSTSTIICLLILLHKFWEVGANKCLNKDSDVGLG